MDTLPPAPAEKLEKIRSVLRKEMPRLREEHSVSSLEIFGSFVRGEASLDSDLDLLVEFKGVPTLLGFIRLENELADLLGLKVDLVMKSGLKPALGRRILAEALQVSVQRGFSKPASGTSSRRPTRQLGSSRDWARRPSPMMTRQNMPSSER